MTAGALVTFALLAADGGIVAEHYDDTFDKKRIHLFASSKKMLASDFTADSNRVVLIEAGNLASVVPDGTKYLTLLTGNIGTFRLTPDSKYALVPGLSGGGLTRIAVTGGSRVELAKGLPMGAGSNLVVSPDSASAAYTESHGALVIADVLEGLAVKLDVPAPKDPGRCHFGAGWVKAFTPDSQRLLYQHGCQGYALVGHDGGVTPMPNGANHIVGDVVLGFTAFDGYDAVPQTRNAVHAAGNTRAVFNAYVDDNKRMDVWVVDFESLTVRRIAPTFPEVGNVHVSPDGRWVLVDTRKGLTSIAL